MSSDKNKKPRVTGIGGLFFKVKDPDKMRDWYETHLGIKSDPETGATFKWFKSPDDPQVRRTVWSLFKDSTEYFNPSEKDFMFNYRVENLVGLLDQLRNEGVTVVGDIEEYEFGKFGWVMDPEGNKIELWEPVDEKYE